MPDRLFTAIANFALTIEAAAAATMMAVQILTAVVVCLVNCSQRTIFWLGVDLIAVISIFWHFWIAHQVEPAELLELIFCQGDQLQTLSYLIPELADLTCFNEAAAF